MRAHLFAWYLSVVVCYSLRITRFLSRRGDRKLRVVVLSLSPSRETRKTPARRISRGHVLLAGFFRVSLDGLSERGTTCSLCVK